MVSEGRLCCWPPRLCVGVPLVVYPVALLNGGSGVCRVFPVLFVVFPVFELDPAPCIAFPRVVLSAFSLCCCAAVLCVENGRVVCVVCVVSSLVFLFLFLFFLPLPFCVGVRGSARAALRARTLSPNTMCSLFSAPRFSSRPVFLLLGNGGGGDSPCVGVLCWHDCDE